MSTQMTSRHGEGEIRRGRTRAADGAMAMGCCGSPTGCGCGDPITSNLYDDGAGRGCPAEAVVASLGCGNPRRWPS